MVAMLGLVAGLFLVQRNETAAAAVNTTAVNNTAGDIESQLNADADAEMNAALDMSDADAAAEDYVEPTAPPPTAAPVQKHVTLDVGLDRFASDATAAILKVTEEHAPKDPEVRAQFEREVAAAVNRSLTNATDPIKKMVAKNWVELKEEKRDMYASLVHDKFQEIFNTTSASFASHAKIKFQKVEDFEKPEEKREHDLSYIVDGPMKRLAGSLKDYAELMYMSNIFVQARTA